MHDKCGHVVRSAWALHSAAAVTAQREHCNVCGTIKAKESRPSVCYGKVSYLADDAHDIQDVEGVHASCDVSGKILRRLQKATPLERKDIVKTSGTQRSSVRFAGRIQLGSPENWKRRRTRSKIHKKALAMPESREVRDGWCFLLANCPFMFFSFLICIEKPCTPAH